MTAATTRLPAASGGLAPPTGPAPDEASQAPAVHERSPDDSPPSSRSTWPPRTHRPVSAYAAPRQCRSCRGLRRLLPDRDVTPAVAGEGLSVPVAPALVQGHAGQARHQVQFRGPHVAERRGEGLEPAIDDPVVVGDGDLRGDVVLLEAEVRRGHAERVDGLAGWETLKLRDVHLDDEATAGLQVRRHVAEARDLFVLRGQVRDRVAHQVRELEPRAHRGGGEVADRHADAVGAGLGVTIGDFATATVGARFELAYLVRNTITNLTTQDEQVACFRNVAAHLEPGGRFVIEVYIPQLQRLPPGETIHAFSVTPTHLGFEEYDIASQIAISHHYWVVDGRLETFSAPFRYVWPAELDLMARLAGMTLHERWSDWNREPFTSDSRSHVSVWEKTT